jgi:hypothetical protein
MKNYEKGPGDPSGPASISAHGPPLETTEPVPYPALSLTDNWAPHVRRPGHLPPPAVSSAGDIEPAVKFSPNLIPMIPALKTFPVCAYKMPSVLSPFPLFPPVPEMPPRQRNSSPEFKPRATVLVETRRSKVTPPPDLAPLISPLITRIPWCLRLS